MYKSHDFSVNLDRKNGWNDILEKTQGLNRHN